MVCFFLYLFLLLLTQYPSYTLSLCNQHENHALLQFKNSVVVYTPQYRIPCSTISKIESWNNGTDCCKWGGITCNNVSGHVTGLDLSCSNLKGKVSLNDTIYHLRHLQKLNLAFNHFLKFSTYSGIDDLVNLTHLNLSYTSVGGNIPSTFSHLSKLVSLDLSSDYFIILDSLTLTRLIHNATNLREIHLDNLYLSSINENSLSQLMNLSSLVSLSLVNNGLQGKFPSEILSLPNLQELYLSNNPNLNGELPKSNWSSPLRYMDLSYTSFSGYIPHSIGQLKYLTQLSLSKCKFEGLVPLSLWNLTQLTSLSLEGNNLQGEIPVLLSNLVHLTFIDLGVNNFSGNIPNVFGNLINLEYLRLSSNNLSGQVPSNMTKHSKLYFLNLSYNKLNGTIPLWCYSLSSLFELYLHDNQITGLIGEFSTYSLRYLYLSNNNLHGDFPKSIYKLQNISDIDLSSNNLSGVVDFHQFSKSKNLRSLHLSHNGFLTSNINDRIADSILPNLKALDLSFNNINNFPKFLAQLQDLQDLDLSNNKIQGNVPKWFHKKLLHTWKGITYIDLSFNKLQGDIPIPPNGIQHFFLSNNKFTGDISLSLCNASSLILLNLAHNNLTGTIPPCIGQFPYLTVFDIQMNNLYGSMPRTFSKGNALETIKLNGNYLEGPLPKSLLHCNKLEVLDIGDNIIEDTFPNWLETLPELQVLSLRSNNFHGVITCSSNNHSFPKLRIFDVSDNKFSGLLPTSCFKNFLGMKNVNDNQTSLQYMGQSKYYYDSVIVVVKGFTTELMRILTTFTTIDLSKNLFEGEIPQVIGDLKYLKGLNLSNNGITGIIPQSLSNLKNLEWLDFSRNQLMGEIPMVLTNLNFLSFLNLSQNHLKGIIPTGQQFHTFGNDSYEDNALLCGFPLSKSCKKDEDQTPRDEDEDESGFGWKSVVIGYACGTIVGLLLGYVVFSIEKLQWLARLIEHVYNIRLK